MVKNDTKVWKTLFKLQELKCSCGANLEVLSVKLLGKKYLLLRVLEKGKLHPEYCCLYDKKKGIIIPPGSFDPDNESLNDPIIQRIIRCWEKEK